MADLIFKMALVGGYTGYLWWVNSVHSIFLSPEQQGSQVEAMARSKGRWFWVLSM
jgi:hypothetical protein